MNLEQGSSFRAPLFSRVPDHALWRCAMYPLTVIYSGVVRFRAWLYAVRFLRSRKLNVRVISIGNIETGGTGKTPFVTGLCEALCSLGRSPAVLSRGHGSGLPADLCAMLFGGKFVAIRHLDGSAFAYPDSLVAHLHADEAVMLSNMLPQVPVMIGRDRFRTWGIFSASGFPEGIHPTDVVLDDGFQHLRIARDIDVVLMSPGVGNAARDSVCLPAGNLREPLAALKRATHLVTVVGRDSHTEFPVARGETARVMYGDLLLMDAPASAGGDAGVPGIPVRPLVACGIARPAPFLDALAARGITPANVIMVPDHGKFDPSELRRVISRDMVGASVPCDAIITTAKDFWRDPQILIELGVPVWILPMSIDFPYHRLVSGS